MKNNRIKEDKISGFGRMIAKIKDWFYNLSVLTASKKKKEYTSIRSRNFNRKIFYWCIVAIPVLHYFIFYICVNVNSILLAFRNWSIVDGQRTLVWVGVENFKIFFNNFIFGTELRNMLSNSSLYYLIGMIVGLPCALFFSFYIYKKYFLSEFFRVMLFLPSMISSIVTVLMYKYLVENGVVEIFSIFGKEMLSPMDNPEYQRIIVIIFNIIMSFGVNILMYSSAMTRIPVSVVEYAQLDGVKPMREFLTITIPLIFDTLSTFLIVGISGFFVNQANLYAMFGHAATSDVATLGYKMFVLTTDPTETTFPEAASMGITFTLIAIPITFGVRWVLNKINPNVQY